MYYGYIKEKFAKILFANFSMGCVGALVLLGSALIFGNATSGLTMIILELLISTIFLII
jgi:hypothetical protein